MRVAHLIAATSIAAGLSPAMAAAQGEGTSSAQTSPAAAPGAVTLQGTGSGRAQGGGAPRSGSTAGRPSVSAVRTARPPTIDGRLNDEIWNTAAMIDTFTQEDPVEGAPATEKTEVRVAYDSEKLYFGIRAHYSDIEQRRANRSDRDKLDNDDTVTLTLEPFLDYLRGYSFAVNGYGVQSDSMIVVTNAQSSPGGNLSYNALYYSGGELTEDGWTAEIAIPIRSLRYPSRKADEAHRWGFQVRRLIKSKDESDVWSPVSRNDPNFLGQIGLLTGVTNLSTQHNFELLPTFTAASTGLMNRTTGEYTTDNSGEGGVGLKYGINSNMTFDFTYNPDFSQVESETQQIDVNQRFPINYPELRPFFLEGREIYEIAGRPQAVQTRRIVDPRYGAKLTGKVGSRSSIGLFLADDEAPGKVEFSNPLYGKTAQNVLGRVKYDLYRNSHVGVIFTDREFASDYSRMLGTDLALRVGETGNVGYRFYKSDRDEAGIRRNGWATELSVRQNGRHLNWASIQNALSPEFGNQLSFVERVDVIAWMPSISYQWFPNTWILNWGPSFSPQKLWDFNGELQNDTRYNPSVSFAFAKSIRLTAGINKSMERYREIDFEKTRWSVSGSVNTNRKVLFSADVSNGDQIRFIANPFLGRLLDFGITATFRPSSRLQSALKLDGNRFTDPVNHAQEFNVKIMRSTTTYQFTSRLVVRNITELNTGNGSNHTLFENILVTYRVNSGTVFYVGYDDRYKEGSAINPAVFSDPTYQRTNRAFFTKLQYLFRTGGAS